MLVSFDSRFAAIVRVDLVDISGGTLAPGTIWLGLYDVLRSIFACSCQRDVAPGHLVYLRPIRDQSWIPAFLADFSLFHV